MNNIILIFQRQSMMSKDFGVAKVRHMIRHILEPANDIVVFLLFNQLHRVTEPAQQVLGVQELPAF